MQKYGFATSPSAFAVSIPVQVALGGGEEDTWRLLAKSFDVM
jgi:hypothetical protein